MQPGDRFDECTWVAVHFSSVIFPERVETLEANFRTKLGGFLGFGAGGGGGGVRDSSSRPPPDPCPGPFGRPPGPAGKALRIIRFCRPAVLDLPSCLRFGYNTPTRVPRKCKTNQGINIAIASDSQLGNTMDPVCTPSTVEQVFILCSTSSCSVLSSSKLSKTLKSSQSCQAVACIDISKHT